MDEFTTVNCFEEEKGTVSETMEVVDLPQKDDNEIVMEKIETVDLFQKEDVVSEEMETIDISREDDMKEVFDTEDEEQIKQSERENEKSDEQEYEKMIYPKKEELKCKAEKIEEVLNAQYQILEQMDALNKLFNAKIMRNVHEEKIVDQMHKELTKYKEDMYAQLIRPILLDVIDVRDSIMRMAAAYLAKPEGEQSIPNKTFFDYSYDLQDILEKNNVEIYRSKSGDKFEPSRQRIIKKILTQDENMHGVVAESLSCGYQYKGRTISAEKIAVYFFERK